MGKASKVLKNDNLTGSDTDLEGLVLAHSHSLPALESGV